MNTVSSRESEQQQQQHDVPQSPGKIKRREVSWTLTKKLDASAGPGEIKRREVVLDPQVSPEEIKRREVVLDPQVSPEETKRREVELGLKESWTSFASAVSQRRSYGHCLCDSGLHSSWDSNCVVWWSLRNAGRTLP